MTRVPPAGDAARAERGPLGAPALPTPRERVRALSVNVTQLLATLDSTTPQAVLEALADAHHNIIQALAAYRAHDDYQAKHRDDTLDGRVIAQYREDAEAIHGTSYYGLHRTA